MVLLIMKYFFLCGVLFINLTSNILINTGLIALIKFWLFRRPKDNKFDMKSNQKSSLNMERCNLFTTSRRII